MLGRYLIQSAAGNAAAAESYWFATIGGTADDYGYDVAYDSTGAVYIVGQNETSGEGTNAQIVKYDSSGTIQWQRDINAGSFANDQFLCIQVDGSDNIYAGGKGNNILFVAKYNTSGTIQWQRKLDGGTSRWYGMDLDSSGNVYVCGVIGSGGTGPNDGILAKYNSSGTLQWQRALGSSGTYITFFNLSIDSSGNIYVAGGGSAGVVCKYNSSGTLQWQRQVSGVSRFNGIGVDSSGDVYATGFATISGNKELVAFKYNSSGTVQWQRSVGSTNADEATGGAVNSSGDVYISAESHINNASYLDGMIVKYNSSGTLQYARTFGNTGSKTDRFNDMKLNGSGVMYISGATGEGAVGQRDLWTLKLPDDGSLTGTYGNFTYQSVTVTSSTSSFTSSTSTHTATTPTLSASTPTYTEAATSFTNTTTTI